MDFGLKNITMFAALKERMKWVNQRQSLLAHNVANADTPKFRPRDLKQMDFESLVRDKQFMTPVAKTSPLHLTGGDNPEEFRSEVERIPFETSPDGNAVVLEEQLTKLSQNQINHKLTSDLYKKHVRMIKMALGK